MESHILNKQDWEDIHSLREAKVESLPIGSVQEVTLNNKVQVSDRWYTLPLILNLGRVNLGDQESLESFEEKYCTDDGRELVPV